jgi:hypothetical protein
MDCTEQSLDQMYTVLQTEQLRILQDLKSGCDSVKEKDNQKQFTMLNTLLINLLRLRNLKKAIKNRMDA